MKNNTIIFTLQKEGSLEKSVSSFEISSCLDLYFVRYISDEHLNLEQELDYRLGGLKESAILNKDENGWYICMSKEAKNKLLLMQLDAIEHRIKMIRKNSLDETYVKGGLATLSSLTRFDDETLIYLPDDDRGYPLVSFLVINSESDVKYYIRQAFKYN